MQQHPIEVLWDQAAPRFGVRPKILPGAPPPLRSGSSHERSAHYKKHSINNALCSTSKHLHSQCPCYTDYSEHVAKQRNKHQ